MLVSWAKIKDCRNSVHTFVSIPVSEHLPTEVGYESELQSGQGPGEDAAHADELH